ncbi:MAG: hypothetical protein HYU77_02805 [Betaproteobacteria bacterium]|nr:hypothetical protein [Betaproteobacteria bacterium]
MPRIFDNIEQQRLPALQETLSSHCTNIVDEIDRALAQHYGISAEQLVFVVNYDIKYRMRREEGSDEGDSN